MLITLSTQTIYKKQKQKIKHSDFTIQALGKHSECALQQVDTVANLHLRKFHLEGSYAQDLLCYFSLQSVYLPNLMMSSYSKLLIKSVEGGTVQFSRSVVSDSLQPHELQHARPPCPSPTPGVYPNSCP